MKKFSALTSLIFVLSLVPSTASNANVPAGDALILTFSGSSSQLSPNHKSQIENVLVSAAKKGWLSEVHCQGLQFGKDSSSKKVLAAKRAKAVCAQVEVAIRGFEKKPYFIYDSGQRTSTKANSGKVALRAYLRKPEPSLDAPSGGPSPTIPGKTNLGRAFYSCYEKMNPDLRFLAKLSSDENSVSLTSVGKFAAINSGILYEDLRCIGDLVGMPALVHAKIGVTNALAGVVEASWTGFAAFWTYHPDNGLNITIYKN